MNKIVVLLCFLVFGLVFVSCSTDEVESNFPVTATQIVASETGGSGGNSCGKSPTTSPKK
ncbi:MAG: hypothetical protein ACK4M4_00770 [Flavobacterium sp.]